jgi:hypothetical protein
MRARFHQLKMVAGRAEIKERGGESSSKGKDVFKRRGLEAIKGRGGWNHQSQGERQS